MRTKDYICGLLALTALTACENDPAPEPEKPELGEEWYSGGRQGTVFNATTAAYSEPMPAISDDNDLLRQFLRGEVLFEKTFVASEGMGYSGLGPVYIRNSCLACHPNYGHGKRLETFNTTDSRNGYLLMIYDPASPTLALASQYFTGMTQTRAVAPFKAPIDETGVHIRWEIFVDKYGNKYADGTPYSADYDYAGTLLYPVVTVDQSAILFPDFDMSKHAASIESTIGIYGSGLLDAISDEDLRAEYAAQQARGYCQGVIGGDITESEADNPYYPGTHPGRFTYLCTRATLDNGPGANAIWNITNVTRPTRQYNYITPKYVEISSKDPEIQVALGLTEQQIADTLNSTSLPVEMSKEDYDAFMVWHRGLAVPAARNLDNEAVQHGRQLFYDSGCTACHRPSWTTRADYKPLPGISNQKIWPYTDLLRHDLDMKEPGRARVCRTTPLWGRGLNPLTLGHSDKLHDKRARNYEEAILWHFGQAEECREKFREMSAGERADLIKFLEAI
ncbi:MAG: hypothetical protein LBR06_05645 [Bacteroidales bacterium]|jgi:hypothetical protein|nr:hypothetical protein [Bacteroidales bacterium]